MMNNELQNPIAKWPFGAATVVGLSATGDQAVDIYNNLTIIDGTTVVATAARTFEPRDQPGHRTRGTSDRKDKNNCNRNPDPGRRHDRYGDDRRGRKTKVAEYVYEGVTFIQTAAAVQID